MTDSLQGIARQGTIQMITPDEFRGRVQSFRNLMANGGSSVGQGVLGGFATVVGPAPALAAGGALCVLLNLAFLAGRRDLRSPDLGAPTALAGRPAP